MASQITVCDHAQHYNRAHTQAQLTIDRLRRFVPQDGEDSLDQLEQCLELMYDAASGMHHGAATMESRLRRYRQSIEALGFDRKREIPPNRLHA